MSDTNSDIVTRKLSDKQTSWIFGKAKEYTDKYIKLIPLDDKAWKLAIDEAHKLQELSRDDKLMCEVMVAAMKYLESCSKESGSEVDGEE